MEKSAERLLRLPVVKQRVGYSKSRIYYLVAEGRFPSPIAIGARASAWLESEIDAWIASRINDSRGAV